MTDKRKNEKGAGGKKPWQDLQIEQLDVPSTTQVGAGRVQPGEAIIFYSNS